ncbi:hypothetical protein EGT74_16750 [Chitinophaga lutea]|uniref:Uncharacterized protein n=1 Tax=Chitinophaga lutea TaxID=2488634 RepID=A0A3N4PKE9_9BACT|nr:hypothetical protein [Chitinophaga lutea]RPE08686.1 hypothetical protein EGT74_16750 [Chitinophaga lutea]
MEILNRIVSPTPPFFRKVRKIGVVLTAIGAAVISIPEQLPEAVGNAGGILLLVGSVMAGISQTAVKRE